MILQPLRYTRDEWMHYLDRLGVPGGFMRYAKLYERYAATMQDRQREFYALLDAGGFSRERYDGQRQRLWEKYARKIAAGQMSLTFKEEDHPRDAEGQFAEKAEAGKATEAEAAKYADYVALMKAHSVSPKTEEAWLKHYREVQPRLKTKEKTDGEQSPGPAPKQPDKVPDADAKQPTEAKAEPAATAENDTPGDGERYASDKEFAPEVWKRLQQHFDEGKSVTLSTYTKAWKTTPEARDNLRLRNGTIEHRSGKQ